MDGWVKDVMNPRQCLLELWKMPRSVESFSVVFGYHLDHLGQS